MVKEATMATYLISFPATATFTLAVLAAVFVAAIALVLQTRSIRSRLRILFALSLCLLASMWALGSRGTVRSGSEAQSSVAVQTRAPASAPGSGRYVTVSTRALAAPRAVYGHSIVKGGIHSIAELLDVIANDPLAAEHYKNFDVSRAYFIRLNHNVMAYVSYRIDGAGIYWTSHPVLIMAGEEVITDGTNYIRVRCGNEISYSQQSPVNLEEEPTDTDTIVQTFTPFGPGPLATEEGIASGNTPSGNSPGGNQPPDGFTGGGAPPPIVFGPPPYYGPPNTPQPPNTPPPPVTNVDEFSSHGEFYSLFGAILLVFVLEKLRR
jgi:hypothetical protein